MKLHNFIAAIFSSHFMIGSTMAETTCTITEKFQCAQGQGCQSVKNTIVVRIDIDRQAYSRCDANGCDERQGQFSISGEFINIALPENGLLAKLIRDGSHFTEVATLGTNVLLSFGSCN